MKLLYYKDKLDLSKEHEIKSNNKHGFTVFVTYNNDFEPEIFNNVTEVHYKYTSMFQDSNRIAIESDIHITGLTHDINYVDTVVIIKANKLEKEF